MILQTRPLHIPAANWTGPSDPLSQPQSGHSERSGKQLILSTKKFKDGHTNAKPQKVKSKYMEQFCICGSRYSKFNFDKKNHQISILNPILQPTKKDCQTSSA